MDAKPQVTQAHALDMQVCVPTSWTDEQVVQFADEHNPSGLDNGWSIRREGDAALDGDPERTPCEGREGYVHIMLDC